MLITKSNKTEKYHGKKTEYIRGAWYMTVCKTLNMNLLEHQK